MKERGEMGDEDEDGRWERKRKQAREGEKKGIVCEIYIYIYLG